MLDYETKKNIDDARDILVGKIPDPKSQVEQITIALIYKFMGDMDKKSKDLGGHSKFFTGTYEKYSWSNIFNPSISGFELVNLYGEALQKMALNDQIPSLFRSIFKNAYLPYRDPETLKAFLKTIDKFNYDHSENLGNAYEYLLSVMGAQGDAGQFRTPRNIIDFIVDAVDPSEKDTILDPACGTAGFLISAYKHILEKNTDKNGNLKLTSDQRTKLNNNFVGYDISPDMIRIALVNLYLHSFKDPKISEYDTLTSEDHWEDRFDVILANPPFMTPKGGIKPHKRFSIDANRCEVLFVDYIAEHLNVNGKAGIIVPEGVIFQSGNAYKKLREMLINDYLYAVVSLPAGVFNPYSMVKTSILLLDKKLAKQTKNILFVKASNDGYGLGAQRRESKENDLPLALEIIKKWQLAILNNQLLELNGLEQVISLIVSKEQIKGTGDYNLSGDRYKIEEIYIGKLPLIELGDILDLNFGVRITKQANKGDKYPVYGGGGESFRTDAYNRENEYVISRFAMSQNCVRFVKDKFFMLDSGFTFSINEKYKSSLKKEYVSKILMHIQDKVYNCGRGHAQKNLDVDQFKSIKIPFPTLEIQEKIIEELDEYQNIIDGAKKVIDNYKPNFKIDLKWEIKNLGEICTNLDYKRKPVEKSERKQGNYPYYGASGVVDYVDNFIFDGSYLLVSEDGANLKARVTPIAFSVNGKIWVNNHAHILEFKHKETQNFVEIYLNTINLDNYITGSAQPKLNQELLNSIKIPFPPLDIQKQIIIQIDNEQNLVNSNKKLIDLFEKKIKTKIDEIWGN